MLFWHLSWVRWCALLVAVGLWTVGCAGDAEVSPVVPASVDTTASTVGAPGSSSSLVTSTSSAPTSTISIRSSTTLLPGSVEIDDTTKQQLVATVRGLFQAIADEALAPSTDHSRIAMYAVSPVLDSAGGVVEALAAKNSHALPARPIVTLIKVVEAAESDATIQFCGFDDQKVVDNASGRYINEAVSHREGEVGLVMREGKWFVSKLTWISGVESPLCLSLEG